MSGREALARSRRHRDQRPETFTGTLAINPAWFPEGIPAELQAMDGRPVRVVTPGPHKPPVAPQVVSQRRRAMPRPRGAGRPGPRRAARRGGDSGDSSDSSDLSGDPEPPGLAPGASARSRTASVAASGVDARVCASHPP